MSTKQRIWLIVFAWLAIPIAGALVLRGVLLSRARHAAQAPTVAAAEAPLSPSPAPAVPKPAAVLLTPVAESDPPAAAAPPAFKPAAQAAETTPGGPPLLALPIACIPGQTCAVQSYMDHDAGPGAKDYRCGARTYDGHSGIDIRIPSYAAMRAGVPVLAAAAGRVRAMRDGMADLSIRDRVGGTNNQDCGNTVIIDHAGGRTTQYCHMRQGSVRVKAGDMLNAGDAIGLVGLTGNTEFPHVHLTVYQDRKVVDPFAYGAPPGACGGGESLWTSKAAAQLAYRAREIFGAGFTSGAPDGAAVDAGALPPATRDRPLLGYVRTLGLQPGDVISLTLTAPDGTVLARSPEAAPLPRDQAVRVTYIGRRTPPKGGWPTGAYRLRYQVTQAGKVVLDQGFELRL